MIDEVQCFLILWGFIGAFASIFDLTDNEILYGPFYWFGCLIRRIAIWIVLLLIKITTNADTNNSE